MHTAPKGYEFINDYSEAPRVGFVFEWSPVFNIWLDVVAIVTICPGELAGSAYLREFGKSLGDRMVFLAADSPA